MADEVHRVPDRADGGGGADGPALGPGQAARWGGGAGLDALRCALEARFDLHACRNETGGDGLPVGEEVGDGAGCCGGREGGGVEDV